MASAPGIVVRHRAACPAKAGGGCCCLPAFEAWAFSPRDNRKIRKTFDSLANAKRWRRQAVVAVGRRELRASEPVRLREAAYDLIAGMRDGSIRNRSGDIYKPSVSRGYQQALERHVLPELGAHRLADITRADLNRLVERLRGKPSPRKAGATLDAATIRNAILPLRVIYRNALDLGRVHINPTVGLALSAVRGKRDRVAAPEEAAALVSALPEKERALWATAFYAGLRLGELRGLRWEDMNLATGVVSVERSWDPHAGPVAPKSQSGRRVAPIPADLREIVSDHRARCAWSEGLVFGRSHDVPFNINGAYNRARRAWSQANLEAITLHEARHTYASLMIAAGVNAKELASYMGHASITITLDRYGHLFPSAHAASAELLDTFLARHPSATASA